MNTETGEIKRFKDLTDEEKASGKWRPIKLTEREIRRHIEKRNDKDLAKYLKDTLGMSGARARKFIKKVRHEQKRKGA